MREYPEEITADQIEKLREFIVFLEKLLEAKYGQA